MAAVLCACVGAAQEDGACAAADETFAVRVFRYTLEMRDGAVIDARAYAPAERDETLDRAPTASDAAGAPLGVAVFAHGGCFTTGDCESHASKSRSLASRGLVVVDTSFRQGAAHPHPAALRDLADVAAASRRLGAPFGVAGSSSGGFFALALAADPARWGAGAPFDFALAFCPVFDPRARADYLRACVAGTAGTHGAAVHGPARAAQMLAQQAGYFPGARRRSSRARAGRKRARSVGGDAEMDAAAALVRAPGAHHGAPTRVFAVLGGADKNVPAAVTLGLQAYAHKTLVVGQRGHELQMALDEDDLATVAHWLRHAANRTRAVYEE